MVLSEQSPGARRACMGQGRTRLWLTVCHHQCGRADPLQGRTQSVRVCAGRLGAARGRGGPLPEGTAAPAALHPAAAGAGVCARNGRSPPETLRRMSTHFFPPLFQPKQWDTGRPRPYIPVPGSRVRVPALCPHGGHTRPRVGGRPCCTVGHRISGPPLRPGGSALLVPARGRPVHSWGHSSLCPQGAEASSPECPGRDPPYAPMDTEPGAIENKPPTEPHQPAHHRLHPHALTCPRTHVCSAPSTTPTRVHTRGPCTRALPQGSRTDAHPTTELGLTSPHRRPQAGPHPPAPTGQRPALCCPFPGPTAHVLC